MEGGVDCVRQLNGELQIFHDGHTGVNGEREHSGIRQEVRGAETRVLHNPCVNCRRVLDIDVENAPYLLACCGWVECILNAYSNGQSSNDGLCFLIKYVNVRQDRLNGFGVLSEKLLKEVAN